MKKDIRTEGRSSIVPAESKSTYALVSDAAKMLDDCVAKLTDSHKLQSGARRVLACLAVRDGVSQLDLIRFTHLKAPTISLIVQKMEHDGLISRKADDLDMRLTRVYLTELGIRVNRSIRESVEAVENTAMQSFSNEEKEQLHALLIRFFKNMEAAQEQ